VPDMPHWLDNVLSVLIVVVPYALWTLYCLFAVNWKKMWPTLAEGAWVPALLLIVLVALVWSQVHESDSVVFGIVRISNFWWQLLAVSLLAALGLFAGWVQDRYGLAPFEYAVAPAAHGHGHDHADDHGHGHDHAAAPSRDAHDDHGHHAPAHH
jgi:hypothetical protein